METWLGKEKEEGEERKREGNVEGEKGKGEENFKNIKNVSLHLCLSPFPRYDHFSIEFPIPVHSTPNLKMFPLH